ncbi:unnamed protein product [Dovyalis caffra]|uniref:ABC-type xenobiotic transporter n=1 Tax=Dovyalis caffra TaxID=77055 RepID=A0AAV1SVQ7_9ROSI|nr:unnamed protein product [Dovyalis caffra]
MEITCSSEPCLKCINRKEMIFVGICAFLRTLAVLASPLLLYAFVQYTNDEHKHRSKGLILVGCLAGIKFMESLSQRQWYFNSRRSAIMVAIYRKQLQLSSLGRRRHSTGEIMSYIAVDAYRMGDTLWWFHMAWSLVLQLFLAIGILFKVVSLGALPAQDARLRATMEILNNVKIIKLQSWEDEFREVIDSLRVVFIGCVLTRSAPLNAATIFTVLVTLRGMSEPMRWIPEALYNCIEIQEGNYSWEPELDVLTLKDINMEAKMGQKVAIWGPVCCGKSSLLHAVLGEISKISGSSGTVRDNILCGKPMDRTRYDKIIKACALEKDLSSFNHGDLTEIGERGINLSGGQKQRIQVARAVYNDANIYLLDDPFSAVDAHTAAVLFNDCVLDALKDKTVILVTHQVDFLTKSDKNLFMEAGQIIQSGGYEELLTVGTAFKQLVNAHKNAVTDQCVSSDYGNRNKTKALNSDICQSEDFSEGCPPKENTDKE